MYIPLIEIKSKKNKSLEHFIDFWSSRYAYGSSEEMYGPILLKGKFNENDIKTLFTWKNGMSFEKNVKKSGALNKITAKLDLINKLKKDFNLTTFETSFEVSAVWKIFLLHIIRPNEFPIFDQHVYRAHKYMVSGKIIEIPSGSPKKWMYYIKEYLPFFNQLDEDIIDARKVDKALWAFGKFLKDGVLVFDKSEL